MQRHIWVGRALKSVMGLLSLGLIMSQAFADGGAEKSAERQYGMAGCGLGSLVMGSGGVQISAATTNATFFSQPFGILSGTSNCIPTGESWAVNEQENFVTANLASLSRDAAQGHGDSLSALASMMGCKKEVVGEFGRTTQKAYGKIFAEPGALAVLDAIRDEVRSNGELASQCDRT